MKWIKFSEHKPENGTVCLCKSTDSVHGNSGFDVAEYKQYWDGESWIIYGEYGQITYLSDDYYDSWIPIDEVDKELSHEVD